MKQYHLIKQELRAQPKTWLITGCAGFIGSNILETLLNLDQNVVGLDNFSTGHRRNLDEVRDLVGDKRWRRFSFVHGDIRDSRTCKGIMRGVDHVLHQAALGSVPRSIQDPTTTNDVNISGFLNVLVAAKEAEVSALVYAASSSTYGDHPALPKFEENIGKPLSPYAVTKYVNELYADVFARCYNFETIGLRYFNVFGQRQDPNGAYAAVIPKWISSLLKGDAVYINGDGETSRDFCYIENVVQANLLAATTKRSEARNQIYNVAVGDCTTLNGLFEQLRENLKPILHNPDIEPHYREFRVGDVRHSKADIGKAMRLLGYSPTHRLSDGIAESLSWYLKQEGRLA